MPPPFSPTRATSVVTAINLLKLNTASPQYTGANECSALQTWPAPRVGSNVAEPGIRIAELNFRSQQSYPAESFGPIAPRPSNSFLSPTSDTFTDRIFARLLWLMSRLSETRKCAPVRFRSAGTHGPRLVSLPREPTAVSVWYGDRKRLVSRARTTPERMGSRP